MKRYFMLVLVAICAIPATADESIIITATPRYPWNGKVDLKFTIDGTSGTKYDTLFTAKDVAGGTNLTLKTLYKSNGTAANAAKEQLLPGTYNWVWDATADLSEGTVLDRVVVEGKAEKSLGGVQLWENGPYWAECNVGATKPEESGYYFWWGDTVGYLRSGGDWIGVYDYYSGVTWVSSSGTRLNTSPFAQSICPTCNKSVDDLRLSGYINSEGNLVADYDAAATHLGVPWRMPTDAECSALINNCTTKWELLNGVWGRRMTGKGAYKTKSIFIPAGGYGEGTLFVYPGMYDFYWSSTPKSDKFQAYYYYSTESELCQRECSRYRGQLVRPLRIAK